MTTVAILGPGAIGGLLAVRLGQAGHDVTLIGRHPAGVTVAGLTLTAPGTAAVTTRPASRPYLTHPVEFLIVTVKATQLIDATTRVPAAFTAGGTVVPFLNGVDHLPYLRAVYPADTVAATIVVEATKLADGTIEQATPVRCGHPRGCARRGCPRRRPARAGRSESAASLLDVPGLEVTVQPGEAQVMWQKLCMLATYALLTTAAEQAIGAAREKFAAGSARWPARPAPPRRCTARTSTRRRSRPRSGACRGRGAPPCSRTAWPAGNSSSTPSPGPRCARSARPGRRSRSARSRPSWRR